MRNKNKNESHYFHAAAGDGIIRVLALTVLHLPFYLSAPKNQFFLHCLMDATAVGKASAFVPIVRCDHSLPAPPDDPALHVTPSSSAR